MSIFTTPRERTLWIWTAVAVIGIYATLGVAGSLAEVLAARRMMDGLFVRAFMIMVPTIAMIVIVRRPGPRHFFVAIGVGAVYMMLGARLGIPVAERSHLFEYGVVAVLIHQALLERGRGGRGVRYPAIVAFLATATLGCIDEGIQWLIPNRVFDPIDMGFNVLAAFITIAGSVVLMRIQTWMREMKKRRKGVTPPWR